MRLTTAARAFRTGYIETLAVDLSCLGYLWLCVLTSRRDKLLREAIAVLIGDCLGLAIGRGDCLLRPLQQGLGGPVPLFELVLPRRAVRAAPHS